VADLAKSQHQGIGTSGYKEVVVAVNRVSKVVKGGKRMSFNSMVVIGDEKGQVGCAMGKAKEVQIAIQKAVNKARKNLVKIPVFGTTIPHEVIGRCGAAKVLLKPAAPGTGIITSNTVRAVVECCGIRDVLSKCLGSRNSTNVVYATIDGLKRLYSKDRILKLRGKI
jgi:small subunit ribosomal protein S5